MKKLTMLVALMVALCMVFTGCGGKDGQQSDPKDNVENVQKPEAPVYESREVWLCVRATEVNSGGNTSVKEYTYDAYGNQIREVNSATGGYTENTYDAWGHPIKTVIFSANGEAEVTSDMTYDADGRLLHEVTVNSSGELMSECDYTYDSEGYLLEEVQKLHYYDSVYRNVYTYNEAHTQYVITSYENDALWGSTEETYDADGNLLSSRTYRADGSFYNGVDCAYDQKGRLTVEWISHGGDMQSSYDVQYTYDENGLLIYKCTDSFSNHGITYEYELFTIQVRVK